MFVSVFIHIQKKNDSVQNIQMYNDNYPCHIKLSRQAPITITMWENLKKSEDKKAYHIYYYFSCQILFNLGRPLTIINPLPSSHVKF